jgi:ribose transport system substrate-binding protein
MKPNQRHQKIIELLMQNGQVSVDQLMSLLQVSAVTVRNDLRTLQQQEKLIRTRGGAAVGKLRSARPTDAGVRHGPGHAAAEAESFSSAQRIAQRAAAFVREGDTILIDSSPLTLAMVDYLAPIKSLTVLTNSIFIATTLAHNPTNQILLLGGELQLDHDTLDGRFSGEALSQLRIRKAFLACDGVSHEQGFASDDLDHAKVKTLFLGCASEVVLLAPAEAIGRPALISFASLSQAHYLITTDDVPSALLMDLRAAGVHVSLCGQHLTQIPIDMPEGHKYRIGFANLNEQQEFAVTVRRSLEMAAQASGNIELIVADNAADPRTALTIARSLVESRVDLVIEYQQDEHMNHVLMDMFRSAHIPVIAVDIPMPGATFFGADNYRAGRMGGEAAVAWIQEHWQGQLDRLVCLEQRESGHIPQMRLQAQIDSLMETVRLPEQAIVRCDTRGDLEGSQMAATTALRNIPWGKRVLFVGINSNSTLGSLAAAEALDRQQHTAVISQNATPRLRRELLRRNPMLIGAVDYFPRHYGEKIIGMAASLLAGRPVPPAVYTDHLLLTPDNLSRVYPDDKLS